MSGFRATCLFVGLLGVMAIMDTVDAADQLPGAPQGSPILLSGADVYTVSGDVIPGGDVLFDRGKIVAVGKSVDVPPGARRVDVTGKRIYPGLFATGNDLGLVEVRSVRGADDAGETGTLNPNIRAEVAINPDSELIPVARANGVLLNLTRPEGSIMPGSSAVLQLDGWTWQDLTLKAPAAIHVTWPSMSRPRVGRSTQRADAEPTPKLDEQLKALDEAFADARAYGATRSAEKKIDHDARWEAMGPLLEGKLPLVVAADEVRQIRAAVAFARREKVKLVILGGYDAPLCADLLKAYDVPVIVNGVHRLPIRPDAPYDEPFTLPARLREAGVTFCITLSHRFGGSDVRNLPYHAATAAAHGLPADEALKAITLYPAQILGCADRVGSLEAGKDATLIVTNGDILETPTHVEMAFVQGRQVDLSSKHTQLWQKYREKYRRQSGAPAAGQAAGRE